MLKACSKSAIKSLLSSIPIDILTRSGGILCSVDGIAACDMLTGKLIELCSPPKLTEILNSSVLSTTCVDKSTLLVSKQITLPPPVACCLCTLLPGCVLSVG